ncbi:YkvI family membrane protein [Trueperella pyogenes]|uniref:YkvI family membrane protein n=1 Tax=Trueperella pyogenes TaxID=1661 RepID=UPI00345D2C99
MLKRVLVIALAFIGVVVGAGFASGQEVLQYFVAHGPNGVIAAFVTALLMSVVGAAAFQLGSYSQAKDHSTVFNRIAHPIAARLLDAFIVFTLFCIGFVMIAGAGSNLQQQFGLPIWAGSVLMCTLVATTGLLDVNKVTRIIGAITPFMIVIIFVGSAYALLNPDGTIAEMQVYAEAVKPAISNWVLSAVNYVAFGFAVGASMMIVMGGGLYDPKAAGIGGLVGGVMFGGLVILSTLALFVKLPSVADAPMPMLALVNTMSPAAGTFMAVVIYGMIYNTAIGMYYALAKRVDGFREGWFRPALFLSVAAGFALSCVGFEALVGTLYPAIGFVGIALTILILWGWFAARIKISEEARRRARILRLFRRRWQRGVPYTRAHHRQLREEIAASNLDNHEAVVTLRDHVVPAIEADPAADLEPSLVEHYGYDEDGFANDVVDFRHPADYEEPLVDDPVARSEDKQD